MSQRDKRIVVIGGGTGSYTVLRSLRGVTPDLSAIVNMVDDGGSSGKLRDELGVLPPGDVRQCLVAMSNAPNYLRKLFDFRFAEGDLAGHSFGNLFLSALEQMNGNFSDAVEKTAEILNVEGLVLPVTLENVSLEMTIDGRAVSGQANIEAEQFDGKIRPQFSTMPKAEINPKAKQAILRADLVVIAPGNLYSSLVPTLLMEGMSDALHATKARLVMIGNLVNKRYQTNGYSIKDYVSVLTNFLAVPEDIDAVIYQNSAPRSDLLKRYAAKGEMPVTIPSDLGQEKIRYIGADIISTTPIEKSTNDGLMRVPRNLIRHDEVALRKIIIEYLDG